jgi:endonuclease/exonuclease/phosphatase family metal-dependent hydrolase
VGLSERIEDIEDVVELSQSAASAGLAQGAQGAHEAVATETATRALRVMTYNVLSGGWPRVDALEAVMRDARADLIGLQEAHPRTLAELANRLGMYRALAPSRRGSAVGLLSRWPLRAVYPHADAPMRNALLEMVVEPPDAAPLRVFVAHLAAGYAAWRGGEGERLRELAYILGQMGQRADAATGATGASGVGGLSLLMGDFNSLPPGERLLASRLLLHAARNDIRRAQGEDMTGQPGVARVLPRSLRPLANALLGVARTPALAWVCDLAVSAYVPRAVVRQTRAAGYTDLYTVTHPDPRRREMSCPAEQPAGRIDYIFASPALAAGLLTCELLGETATSPVLRASDHRPMLATLALTPAQE